MQFDQVLIDIKILFFTIAVVTPATIATHATPDKITTLFFIK